MNAVFGGDYPVSSVIISDLLRLLSRKLRERAIFLHSVYDVVEIGAFEQMVRPYARGVIAPVKNMHSLLNRAVSQNPGNAMRPRFLGKETRIERAISTAFSLSGCPLPTACVRLVDFCPESRDGLLQRMRSLNATAGLATADDNSAADENAFPALACAVPSSIPMLARDPPDCSQFAEFLSSDIGIRPTHDMLLLVVNYMVLQCCHWKALFLGRRDYGEMR